VVTGTVVVVPPGTVVVVPGTVVVVPGTVVVVTGQGQFNVTFCPTAFFIQIRASLEVTVFELFVSQVHDGNELHVAEPTAVLRMTRQSEAVGLAPLDTGWLQSPLAARAADGSKAMLLKSSAAPIAMRCRRVRVVNKAEPPPRIRR